MKKGFCARVISSKETETIGVKKKIKNKSFLRTFGWSRVGTEVLTVTLMGLSLVTSQNLLLPPAALALHELPFTEESLTDPPLSSRSISMPLYKERKKERKKINKREMRLQYISK
jgi:hypothetical protein